MKYDNEADLLEQANDSCFGLAAGIWTENYRKAWRMARALEVGTVWINTYKSFLFQHRLVALKTAESVVKRTPRHFVLYAAKSIYMGLNEQPNPWAD